MDMNLFQNHRNLGLFFEYFGLFIIICYAIKYALIWLRTLYVYNTKAIHFKKYGKWAVVTGCTDGIGRSYAKEMARRGMDLVLISRNLAKLNELSDQLKLKHNIQTLVISADFTG